MTPIRCVGRALEGSMQFDHQMLVANGLTFHVATTGSGPLVLLAHGFPELWYCWRHQMRALAGAGYRVAAPDLRGYGASDAPEPIDHYTILHLAGDLVGLVRALGAEQAHLVGHDWGSALAWNAALMRPDVFRTMTGISVPFQPRRADKPPIASFREIAERKGLGEFYMVRFQAPGIAEAEYESDLERTFRIAAHTCAGATPADERFEPFLAAGESLLGRYPTPERLPEWLSAKDLSVFVDAYRAAGFRGPLNWYRNLDRNWELTAPFQGARIHQPALYITGEHDHVRRWTARAEAALADNVPGLIETRVVPGAGHWVHQEAPEAVNTALLGFLNAHP
jgi:pimeloyl-ACP methyl ester carboxylesterase